MEIGSTGVCSPLFVLITNRSGMAMPRVRVPRAALKSGVPFMGLGVQGAVLKLYEHRFEWSWSKQVYLAVLSQT